MPSDAKALKVALQSKGWLDRKYRMTKLKEVGKIAVPVTKEGLDVLTASSLPAEEVGLNQYIQGIGMETMPLSTAQFAANK